MQDFPYRDTTSEAPPSAARAGLATSQAAREKLPTESAAASEGRTLIQDSFFFCDVKMIGDIPGGGSIYVEIVVDRESGTAFAKVYPTQKPINGVDILETRALPFFRHQGGYVQEVRTRTTSEYCGLTPRHPFETFLATQRIEHPALNDAGDPDYYACEELYWFLRKEFFQPALRKQFQLSLEELQRDLDAFVEHYNSSKHLREDAMQTNTRPSVNFPVDL
jgi:hypothetical protein